MFVPCTFRTVKYRVPHATNTRLCAYLIAKATSTDAVEKSWEERMKTGALAISLRKILEGT
jgi:hypothetical protein